MTPSKPSDHHVMLSEQFVNAARIGAGRVCSSVSISRRLRKASKANARGGTNGIPHRRIPTSAPPATEDAGWQETMRCLGIEV